MDISLHSGIHLKKINSPKELDSDTEKAAELERMLARSKNSWRSHWLLGHTAFYGFRHCNFITLPGPELLDVKALVSGDFRLHSVTLVERKLSHVSRIYKNLLALDGKFDSLSQAEQRDLAAFNLGLLNLDDPIIKPRFTLLQGRFEDISLYKLVNVLNSRLDPVPTIICLDFCGVYLLDQHLAIISFLNSLREVEKLRGQEIFLILNFCTFSTIKYDLEDKVVTLAEAKELAEEHGKAKHRCSTCYESSKNAINLFGEFLEYIPDRLVEGSLKGLNLEVASPATHYQNGIHNRIGYTTHGFVYTN